MASIIKDDLCVEANINVAPDVRIKHIQTCFVGEPAVEACAENSPECSYAVSQMICVKYTLSFNANVQAEQAGIICNPQVHACSDAEDPGTQEPSEETDCEPAAKEQEYQASDVQDAPAEAEAAKPVQQAIIKRAQTNDRQTGGYPGQRIPYPRRTNGNNFNPFVNPRNKRP